MNDTNSLVIVYQFGKVASTSLVNALNRSPGVEAHQCHFLGEDALRKSVTNATDSKLSPYFRKHLVGQLFANLDLTYRVNRILDRRDDTKLAVISLSREPVDWLRSCIQQDIEGYKDEIISFSQDYSPVTCGGSIEHGLTQVLICLGTFIDKKGGIQDTIEAFRRQDRHVFFNDAALGPHEIVRRMLMLSFRPLLWFEDHFETCFDISLSEFNTSDGYWLKVDQPVTYLILRYEDIQTHLSQATSAAGLEMPSHLTRSNASAKKPFAAEINAAFKSPAATVLRNQILKSHYAAFFGYTEAADSAAA